MYIVHMCLQLSGTTKIAGLFFYIILFVFQLRDQSITWDVNFSSAFFLMAEKTSVEAHQEQLEFGPEDLINGLGGALGLFLGWSILYLGKAQFNHFQIKVFKYSLYLYIYSYSLATYRKRFFRNLNDRGGETN